jgi:hypothetical protein
MISYLESEKRVGSLSTALLAIDGQPSPSGSSPSFYSLFPSVLVD